MIHYQHVASEVPTINNRTPPRGILFPTPRNFLSLPSPGGYRESGNKDVPAVVVEVGEMARGGWMEKVESPVEGQEGAHPESQLVRDSHTTLKRGLRAVSELRMSFSGISADEVYSAWSARVQHFIQNPPLAGSSGFCRDMTVCPAPAVFRMLGLKQFEIHCKLHATDTGARAGGARMSRRFSLRQAVKPPGRLTRAAGASGGRMASTASTCSSARPGTPERRR